MQEYRTRLTADVVTGKLDVRPAAAKLPDITSDSSPDPATEATEPEERSSLIGNNLLTAVDSLGTLCASSPASD